MRNILYLTPRSDETPLFSYKSNGKIVWWTHNSFVERLREILKQAGYEPTNFTCHSFRRGGASLAFKLGLSLTEVKIRGDWRSHAVESYVNLDFEQEKNIAKRLIIGASHMW